MKTCTFCHSDHESETMWESKVNPGNYYCHDEVACTKRWWKDWVGMVNCGTVKYPVGTPA